MCSSSTISSVQSLSRVWLFATPWTAAHQASLSITNSQSLFKLMSMESVMPSNHLILCHPLLLLPSIFPSIRVFSWWVCQFFASGGQSTGVLASASVLPMNIQGWFPLGLIGLPRGETQNLSTITGSDSCWLWDVMSKLLNLTSLFFPFQHSNYRYLLCSAHNHCTRALCSLMGATFWKLINQLSVH